MTDAFANRRDFLTASLLALAGASLASSEALAAGVDPTMTIITPPNAIPWKPLYNFPAGMAEQANMVGAIGDPGQ